MRYPAAVLSLLLLGSACGEEPAAQAPQKQDPIVAGALNDPLMSDPDLSSRNEGAAAVTVQVDGPLPVLPLDPDAVASARVDAAAMIGGADKLALAIPVTGRAAPLAPDHEPADHLAVLASKTACRAKLVDSAIWAARLPKALPVFPRGATLSATGGEGAGCRVMAVDFVTPVALDEVLAFYWQRARQAGMAPVRLSAGSWAVLQGQGGGTAFDLRARREGEQTLVELASVSG